MRLGAAILLSVLLGFILLQIGKFEVERRNVQAQFSEIQKDFGRSEEEYKKLEADFKYYSNPVNLEKELRARFNYRAPGETQVIIVPKASSTP